VTILLVLAVLAVALAGPLTYWCTRTGGGQPITWCPRLWAYHPVSTACPYEHVSHPGITSTE
jgi:protein-S-isoprenylcysteine O-methyltransferase Ste14